MLVLPAMKAKCKSNHLISKLYKKLGKKGSTSREQTVLEVETQMIDDSFGDKPM